MKNWTQKMNSFRPYITQEELRQYHEQYHKKIIVKNIKQKLDQYNKKI